MFPGQWWQREEIEGNEPSAYFDRLIQYRDRRWSDGAGHEAQHWNAKSQKQHRCEECSAEARPYAHKKAEAAETQLGQIDRNRPNPPELKQYHCCGTDQIEMTDRIGCEPIVEFRAAVAHDASDDGERKPMDCNNNYARAQANEKLVEGKVVHVCDALGL
jgi:hypothetical protein